MREAVLCLIFPAARGLSLPRLGTTSSLQPLADEQGPIWDEYSFDMCRDNNDWNSRCYALCKTAGGQKSNPPWFRVGRGKILWPWSSNMRTSYPGEAIWPMYFVYFDALPADLLQQVRKKLLEPALM